MKPHWRRFNRALEHVDSLDKAIRRWLDTNAYRIVKERDAEARRTAYVARIAGTIPPEWGDLAGEVAYGVRSALDHLAFALNSKGYADAHNGAALPSQDATASEFPIIGNENKDGMPADGKHLFASAAPKYRNMPSGAQALLKRLQPYQRGDDYTSDPLWILHSLSRVDKHRIPLGLSAALPRMTAGYMYFPAVSDAAIGIGGPVYDGKELSYWVVPEGAEEPDTDLRFTRDVAFGEGTAAQGMPVVSTLRDVRNYVRMKVAFPLDRFL